MALDNDQDILFTGSGDGELKAWRVDHDALASGVHESQTGEVRSLAMSFSPNLDSTSLVYRSLK
jgi:hypothetical protein